MAEKEWQATETRGKEVIQKKIKVKEEPIKHLPAKAKDKLDLVLEEIQGVSKKIDKLKKEKAD
ncbi:hypothetical protein ES703_16074 [subsurface metagenome]